MPAHVLFLHVPDINCVFALLLLFSLFSSFRVVPVVLPRILSA